MIDDTEDFESNETCPKCGTIMVHRVRTDVPPAYGSQFFQAEWYHCPSCNRMRKLIDGAALLRTKYQIELFGYALEKKKWTSKK